MKKSLLIISLAACVAIPAFAELTVDDAISRDYLKNHGHSTATINVVQKEVASINGEPLEEPLEYKYYSNPVARFVRKVFMYFDPAMDDHSFLNDHDIKTSPSYTDL